MVFGGFKFQRHAFIYNYCYSYKEHPWCIGALVDNRTQKPVRLVEDCDRKTVYKSREVFIHFFCDSTRIDRVHIV